MSLPSFDVKPLKHCVNRLNQSRPEIALVPTWLLPQPIHARAVFMVTSVTNVAAQPGNDSGISSEYQARLLIGSIYVYGLNLNT